MQRQSTDTRRHQIAAAALEIIAREGVRKFTTALLAKEIGVAEGTLFRHVRDKQEIVQLGLEYLESLMFPAAAPPAPEQPLEALRQFLQLRVAVLRAHPGSLRVLFSQELGKAAPGVDGMVARLRERSIAIILGHLQRAKAQGLLRDDVAVESVFVMIHGLLLSQAFAGPQVTGVVGAYPSFDALWQDVLRMIVAQPADRQRAPAEGATSAG